MQLLHGTLPTRDWLSKHGWKVDPECQTCGMTETANHVLQGRLADEQEYMGISSTKDFVNHLLRVEPPKREPVLE